MVWPILVDVPDRIVARWHTVDPVHPFDMGS